jgi:uncharacterized protein YyaL (SSP411 family)
MFVTWLDGPREVAVVEPSDSVFREVLAQGTAPGMVYAWGADQLLMQNRTASEEKATAYVCRGFVCAAPTTDLNELKKSIGVVN